MSNQTLIGGGVFIFGLLPLIPILLELWGVIVDPWPQDWFHWLYEEDVKKRPMKDDKVQLTSEDINAWRGWAFIFIFVVSLIGVIIMITSYSPGENDTEQPVLRVLNFFLDIYPTLLWLVCVAVLWTYYTSDMDDNDILLRTKEMIVKNKNRVSLIKNENSVDQKETEQDNSTPRVCGVFDVGCSILDTLQVKPYEPQPPSVSSACNKVASATDESACLADSEPDPKEKCKETLNYDFNLARKKIVAINVPESSDDPFNRFVQQISPGTNDDSQESGLLNMESIELVLKTKILNAKKLVDQFDINIPDRENIEVMFRQGLFKGCFEYSSDFLAVYMNDILAKDTIYEPEFIKENFMNRLSLFTFLSAIGMLQEAHNEAMVSLNNLQPSSASAKLINSITNTIDDPDKLLEEKGPYIKQLFEYELIPNTFKKLTNRVAEVDGIAGTGMVQDVINSVFGAIGGSSSPNNTFLTSFTVTVEKLKESYCNSTSDRSSKETDEQIQLLDTYMNYTTQDTITSFVQELLIAYTIKVLFGQSDSSMHESSPCMPKLREKLIGTMNSETAEDEIRILFNRCRRYSVYISSGSDKNKSTEAEINKVRMDENHRDIMNMLGSDATKRNSQIKKRMDIYKTADKQTKSRLEQDIKNIIIDLEQIKEKKTVQQNTNNAKVTKLVMVHKIYRDILRRAKSFYNILNDFNRDINIQNMSNDLLECYDNITPE